MIARIVRAARASKLPMTRRSLTPRLALLSTAVVLGAAALASSAQARAVCRDLEDCRREIEIMPPIPPPEPGPPVPRQALRVRDVAARMRVIAPRVSECVATHFEGERPPRRLLVTVFISPDGRWSVGFGPRAAPPVPGVEARGATPLEVCVANWISSEIGPRLQPPGGRTTRRVTRTYRIAALPAEGAGG